MSTFFLKKVDLCFFSTCLLHWISSFLYGSYFPLTYNLYFFRFLLVCTFCFLLLNWHRLPLQLVSLSFQKLHHFSYFISFCTFFLFCLYCSLIIIRHHSLICSCNAFIFFCLFFSFFVVLFIYSYSLKCYFPICYWTWTSSGFLFLYKRQHIDKGVKLPLTV